MTSVVDAVRTVTKLKEFSILVRIQVSVGVRILSTIVHLVRSAIYIIALLFLVVITGVSSHWSLNAGIVSVTACTAVALLGLPSFSDC